MKIQNTLLKVVQIKRIYKSLDGIENKKGQTELSKVIEKQNNFSYYRINIIV